MILRSSVAHGRIRRIDGTGALNLPGVRAVITARDLGPDVPRIPLRLQSLPELEPFRQPMLADGKVRFVGEPMAVIVAESAAIAEDALELIEVDIESLPAVTGRVDAEATKAILFEAHGSNVSIGWTAVRGDQIPQGPRPASRGQLCAHAIL